MTGDQIAHFLTAVRAGRITISHGDTTYRLRAERDGSVAVLKGRRAVGSVFLGGVVGDPPVVIALRDALPSVATSPNIEEEPVEPAKPRRRRRSVAA